MFLPYLKFLASLAVLLVPGLVTRFFDLPENFKYFLFGLCTGAVGGWWFCHFFSNHRTERIKAEAAKLTAEQAKFAAEQAKLAAEAALLAEQNAEKDRQYRRDREKAEETRKNLVAKEQAKAIAEENKCKMMEAAEKEKLEKAIESIKKRFEINDDGNALIRKRGDRTKRYCVKCGHGKGEECLLKVRQDGDGWRCPKCGDWTSPPFKPEESFNDQVRRCL